MRSEEDTRNFDIFEENVDDPFHPEEEENPKNIRKDMDFVGYTFKKDTQRDNLMTALEELETIRKSTSKDKEL